MLGGDVAQAGQHVGEVVAGAVGHGQPLEGRVGPDLVIQVGQRLAAGALLGLLGHLAVLELDHRLDVQQRTEQRPGAPDAGEMTPPRRREPMQPMPKRVGSSLVNISVSSERRGTKPASCSERIASSPPSTP